jgi:hypothetical protein
MMPAPMRHRLIAAWCVAFASAVTGARAQESECAPSIGMQAAITELERDGATRLGDPVVEFLPETRFGTTALRLEHDGCVGVLAIGHALVSDLDLALYTSGGIELARDVQIDAHPYVRYCGSAGLEIVALVHMFRGRGEYHLQAFEDAPASLPDLNRTVGGCFASSAGFRSPPVDVGAEPRGVPLDRAVSARTEALDALGYRPLARADQVGALEGRDREVLAIELNQGACYAIAAVGGDTVLDLDIYVRAMNGSEVARDDRRERDAVAKFCVGTDPRVLVEVRMFDGAGDFLVRTFRLEEPPGALPAGVTGRARVGYAEALSILRARSFEARPLAWGFLLPGRALAMPFQVRAGRCYAFAGVAADELVNGDLDVVLLDEEERRIGWDLGRRNPPVVYHCAERDGLLRVVGRVYGARGRYLALVGEGATAP